MSALIVRDLDPEVKMRLHVQAAQRGIAMEEAVRSILTRAANEQYVAPAYCKRRFWQLSKKCFC